MKIKQIGKHASVVQRLRTPLIVTPLSNNVDSIIAAVDKLNAISEALAYLIEKKHDKRKIKLGTKKHKKDR